MKEPSVSILLPVYNEEACIGENLEIIYNYMKSIEHLYKWDIVIVDDGSKDNTGLIAGEFAGKKENVKIIKHKINKNLGFALRTGFKNCQGKYIIVLDADLSYSPDHIEKLLNTISTTNAKIVIASPYMKGGRVSSVPFFRKILSRTINFILTLIVRQNIHTFTGMVRAYNRKFITSLNLKTSNFGINSEIIYKALILRARIVEIPAHLNWAKLNEVGKKRVSNLNIIHGILTGLMSGFIFRPYFYFLVIGILLLIFSVYTIIWIFH